MIAAWRIYRWPRNQLVTELDVATWAELDAAIEADQGVPPEWDERVNQGGKVTRFTPDVPHGEGTLNYVAEVRD